MRSASILSEAATDKIAAYLAGSSKRPGPAAGPHRWPLRPERSRE